MRCTVFILMLSFLALLPASGEGVLQGLLSPGLREVERKQKEVQGRLNALPVPSSGQTVPELGYMHSAKITNDGVTRWVQVDLMESRVIDFIALFPVQVDSNSVEMNISGFPRRFRVDISDEPDFGKFSPIVVHMDSDFPDPGIAPVLFPADGKKGRYVRISVITPTMFSIGELMVMSGNLNVAVGRPVQASGGVTTPPRWSLDNLVDGKTPIGPPVVRETLLYDGIYAGPPDNETGQTWMQLDLGEVLPIEEIRLHPVHASRGNDLPGYGFPNRLRIEFSDEPSFAQPRTIFDTPGHIEFKTTGNNAVIIPGANAKARYIRVVLVKPAGFIHPRRFGVSEMEVYSSGINVARKAKADMVPDPTPKTKGWPHSILNDGFNSFGRILELPDWLKLWEQRSGLQRELADLNKRHTALVELAEKRGWRLMVGASVLLVVGSVGFVWNGRRIRKRELEEFRRQLAHDLHDEIGSNLAAIGMISEAAARQPSQIEFLQRISQIAHETTDAMRETLWLAGFREEVGMNLMDHLKLAASRILAGCSIEWASEIDSPMLAWSVEDRRQAFLFFKEAVTNVARHSEAKKVILSARIDNGFLELKIQDDGHGFSPDQPQGGLGMESLRHRAERLGGKMQIETAPEKGTCVILRTQVRLKK